VAYTFDDAIAAVASTQAAQPPEKVAYIQASLSITEAAPGTLTGEGPLFRMTPLGLSNLWPFWDSSAKFLMQRGGVSQFLLGLTIESIFTIAGIAIRPPAFLRPLISLLQPLGFVRKRYQGTFQIFGQPQFNVVLTENRINPMLTGSLPLSLAPGSIAPPGRIELVLESVAVKDILG
jgi:hypothetical protein